MSYVALVIGSTGAVGRDLVADLVASAKCKKVIALARRDVPEASWGSTFPSLDTEAAKSKLEVRQVDFNQLSETDIKPADKVDAAFSCLGTTRKDAGSAAAFRKGRRLDLEYVTKFAELSKTAGVGYMGLLTSQGANKDSWFLYPQTKGEVEDKVQQLKFSRLSIFRPGMLQRGDLLRGTEKMFGWMIPGAYQITAGAVAKGMLADYESGAEGLKEYSHADLKKFE
ncbi:Oxidoreductase htatip2 [Phytophthora boehmeriae]|uniref:Oxidoreductase htatip2 n=1 Tax=Phytophthora boehmeriae TaxID=109152 RepID=A0A8T1WD00_9STRA|nr:Oxidoreductase htatip2 [Phytophthora boehmeriae]